MLSSVDRIKEERKKAKANRNKFVGSEGGGFAGTGSKYGGFGSDSYYEGESKKKKKGSVFHFRLDAKCIYKIHIMEDSRYNCQYSNRIGGSGGGGYGGSTGSGGSRGGSRYDDRSSTRSNRYDDDDREPSNSPPVRRTARKTETSKPAAKAEPVKEVNLFDFDEPVSTSSASSNQNTFGGNAAKPAAVLDDGWGSLQSATDDFDDFQSAPPVETKGQASVPSFPAYNPTMASVLPPVRTNNTTTTNTNNNGFGAFGGSSGGSGFDLLGGTPASGGNSGVGNFGASMQPMTASMTQAKPTTTSSFPAQVSLPCSKLFGDIVFSIVAFHILPPKFFFTFPLIITSYEYRVRCLHIALLRRHLHFVAVVITFSMCMTYRLTTFLSLSFNSNQ
jgi:epsin